MTAPWNDSPDAWPQHGEDAADTYRSLSGTALASLIAGLLSIAALLHPIFLVLSLLGIALGVYARRRILRSGGELTGKPLALAGIILSIALGGGGWGVGSYLAAREIPQGYTLIPYARLAADSEHPGEIPSRAFDLQGQKVYIKGYMYPGKLQSGIKVFVMSRDNGTCQFCMPNPQPTDLILVQLMGDLTADYTSRILGVGGRLFLELDPAKRAEHGVAYRLEADYLH